MNIMHIQQVAEQRFPESITWTAPPSTEPSPMETVPSTVPSHSEC